MKILGIDNGYAFTKDSDWNIFKSAYSKTDNLDKGSIEVKINGVTYFVGSGEMICDTDKISSELNMACTIADLCSNIENDYKLVVGLPIGQYNEYKDKLKKTILEYNNLKVEYKGVNKRLNIEDVFVAPQGAAALWTMNVDTDCILVDIGGLTIDMAQIEFGYTGQSIVRTDTLYMGMRKLYNPIIEAVNMRYNMRLEADYADKILNQGLNYNGKKQDLEFLSPVMKQYIMPIIEQLKLSYRTDVCPIFLLGGGASILAPAFQQHFARVFIVEDSQYANANGYAMIGNQMWRS